MECNGSVAAGYHGTERGHPSSFWGGKRKVGVVGKASSYHILRLGYCRNNLAIVKSQMLICEGGVIQHLLHTGAVKNKEDNPCKLVYQDMPWSSKGLTWWPRGAN